MTGSYYNENDPAAAQWLRNLIAAGEIPAGDVDERSIEDVHADDVKSYTQVHLFAGIGGWPLALRIAGWPEDKKVWTGSCPCQPFSIAGKRKNTTDERHLWPHMRRLVSGTPIIFGEQVAIADGRQWLAGVRADLEALGYAVGAADLCAAGIGAPHIRQRLYWVAHATAQKEGRRGIQGPGEGPGAHKKRTSSEPAGRSESRSEWLGDAGCAGMEIRGEQSARQERATVERASPSGRLGNSDRDGCQEGRETSAPPQQRRPSLAADWGNHWIDCPDGKRRRVEPSIPLLAHGVPNRVAKIRGIGNAIMPQLAAKFIQASRGAINHEA